MNRLKIITVVVFLATVLEFYEYVFKRYHIFNILLFIYEKNNFDFSFTNRFNIVVITEIWKHRYRILIYRSK